MKKPLLVLILVSVAVVSVWKLRGRGESENESNLVLDRVWVDHMPKHERDITHFFVAITDEPFGIFQSSSAWKGAFELFRYEANGDEIRIVYPQNGDRERVKTKASKCSDQGMDFCLELDGSTRGVKRYYSRKGWEIDHAATPDQVRAKLEQIESLGFAEARSVAEGQRGEQIEHAVEASD